MTRGTITTPDQLAAELAEHARGIRAIAFEHFEHELADLARALACDAAGPFADAYAQSVSYGLLAARWFSHPRADPQFTRANVCKLLPATSPWVLGLFARLVELDHCPALGEAVDELTDTLSRLAITDIFHATHDPVIHFYQHFLGAYDPEIRRNQGVYSTPTELANYLVHATDAALRERFGLPLGLADPTTWAELASRHDLAIPEPARPDQAFVQILDPATGTGTFLVAIIELVHATMQAEYVRAGLDAEAALRAWQDHVRTTLLPRLRGHELLLAPFIVCHLRIGLALQATGFRFGPGDRVNVRLCDALAPADTSEPPPTVFIGNPPYQRSAGPRGPWAERLVARFKQALEGERNMQPLADDYIAFLGLGDELIGRAGSGVLALVVNGTCLSGRLHRGLRARLLATFDRLALSDLHGSQKVALREDLAAIPDANVFDIQQGVAIVLAERLPGRERSTTVLHHDCVGTREAKLAWLEARAGDPLRDHEEIQPRGPLFLFTSASPAPAEYCEFTPVTELFEFCSVSGKPGKDELLVGFERDALIPGLQRRRAELAAGASESLTEAERKLGQRPRDRAFERACLRSYTYRPGDTRWTYYDPEIWTRPVTALSERLDGRPVLLTTRIVKDPSFAHVWVTRGLADVICLSATSSVNCYSFVGPQSEELFDYVYAILHSPEYRRRYAEALRHDFPRVPISADRSTVAALARLGASLRELHLLERSCELAPEVACFVDGGDRAVTRVGEPRRALAPGGILRINERSRFERVPESVWTLRIGGYQLLHKWLFDRKKAGRELSDADIAHYRRLVGVGVRTVEIMARIERYITSIGGWPDAFARPR